MKTDKPHLGFREDHSQGRIERIREKSMAQFEDVALFYCEHLAQTLICNSSNDNSNWPRKFIQNLLKLYGYHFKANIHFFPSFIFFKSSHHLSPSPPYLDVRPTTSPSSLAKHRPRYPSTVFLKSTSKSPPRVSSLTRRASLYRPWKYNSSIACMIV
jgi:hypothetical protein